MKRTAEERVLLVPREQSIMFPVRTIYLTNKRVISKGREFPMNTLCTDDHGKFYVSIIQNAYLPCTQGGPYLVERDDISEYNYPVMCLDSSKPEHMAILMEKAGIQGE